MKKVNLGIIGLGSQGKLALDNALFLECAKVVAVADVSRSALGYAKKSGIKNTYSDYEQLLRNKEVDAVIINLPNFLHLEGAVKAAEAGKDVLLEKPLARNVEEGQEILSAVRKNNVRLMMGYGLRFDARMKKLREEISDGMFGSVQIAEATNVSGGPFSPKSNSLGPTKVPTWWLNKEQTGGGALLDLGSHMIDLFFWYFGEIAYAKSHLNYLFNTDLEDSATCIIKFKNGTLATVNAGWFSKEKLESVKVCGTARNAMIQIYSKNTLRFIRNEVAKKFGFREKSLTYLKLEHFVHCLQKDEQPKPSGEDGLQSLQIIAEAYKNAI